MSYFLMLIFLITCCTAGVLCSSGFKEPIVYFTLGFLGGACTMTAVALPLLAGS